MKSASETSDAYQANQGTKIHCRSWERASWTRRALIVAGCLLIVVLAVWLRFPSPASSEPGFVSVMHLGYTNNVAGTCFAIFSVTNQWLLPLTREGQYRIQVPSIRSGRHGSIVSGGVFVGGSHVIQPNGSEVVLVPVPSNQEPWRICISVSKEKNGLKEIITATADHLKQDWIADKFRNYKYGVNGEWIEQ